MFYSWQGVDAGIVENPGLADCIAGACRGALDGEDVEVLYAIKAGLRDDVISESRKTAVHSVFRFHEPHGDVYAYVSEWLGHLYGAPHVPHTVPWVPRGLDTPPWLTGAGCARTTSGESTRGEVTGCLMEGNCHPF